MFSNLKKLEVKADKISTYTLTEIDGSPKLFGKPATEANKPFYNQLLKRTKRNSRAIQANQANAEMVKNNRDEDRDLYSKFVITGWSNVVNDKGENVTFNEENCKAFFDALPDWLFDGVRDHYANPGNFLDDMPDAEDTSKN